MKTLQKLPGVTMPKKSRDPFGNVTTYAPDLIAKAREAVKEWTSWETPSDLLDRFVVETGEDLGGYVITAELEADPETYGDWAVAWRGVMIVCDLLVEKYNGDLVEFHGYAYTNGAVSGNAYRVETYTSIGATWCPRA